MNRKLVHNLAKIVITFSLLIWLFWEIDLREMVELGRLFDVPTLIWIFALCVIGILLNTWKWAILLTTRGLSVPFRQLLRLFWIAAFFNSFLPGRTGGDLVRAYGIARGAPNRMRAALSVAMDRGLNLVALIGIAVTAILINPGALPGPFQTSVLGFAITLLALVFLTFFLSLKFSRGHVGSPKVRSCLKEISSSGADLLRNPMVLLTTLILSALYQTTAISVNYLVARGLGLEVDPWPFFYLVPIAALITIVPISLNGFGLREGAYVFLFSHVGLPNEAAMAISIGATICMIGVSSIGGIFYLLAPTQAEVQTSKISDSGPFRSIGITERSSHT